jgi:hypothetical protein
MGKSTKPDELNKEILPRSTGGISQVYQRSITYASRAAGKGAHRSSPYQTYAIAVIFNAVLDAGRHLYLTSTQTAAIT